MRFEILQHQERPSRFLDKLVHMGKVPHALLFIGTAGAGKITIAKNLAMIMNCLAPSTCNPGSPCSSCYKIASGSHPDVLLLEKDGQYIKVEQVREIRTRLRFQPFEGKWRVIIIKDAHKLNAEAANTLLKTLEEPPRQNIFILSTVEARMLLPTIASRCSHIRFQPLRPEQIVKELQLQHDLSTIDARAIAQLSEGSLERVHAFIDDGKAGRFMQVMKNLAAMRDMPVIDLFPFLSAWSKESGDLELDLECIKLWLRDLIISRLSASHEPVVLSGSMPGSAHNISLESLFSLFDQVEMAIQQVRQNANKQLTLEVICMAIKEVMYG